MGRNNQGAFKGTNKLCQQYIKECKQFANVIVVKCNFVSNQKREDTLPLAEKRVYRGNNRGLEPNIEKTGIGMGETAKDTLPLANEPKIGVLTNA